MSLIGILLLTALVFPECILPQTGKSRAVVSPIAVGLLIVLILQAAGLVGPIPR